MFWSSKNISSKTDLPEFSDKILAAKITDLHSPFMPDFSNDTKHAIIETISSCLENGSDSRQTAEKVKPLIPQGYSVDDIVKTESVFLYAKKTYNFAISSNAIATEWQHIPNRKYNRRTKSYETFDDVCTENEKIGGKYLGHRYPSGHLIPPAHLGCRCGIRVMYKNDSSLGNVS